MARTRWFGRGAGGDPPDESFTRPAESVADGRVRSLAPAQHFRAIAHHVQRSQKIGQCAARGQPLLVRRYPGMIVLDTRDKSHEHGPQHRAVTLYDNFFVKLAAAARKIGEKLAKQRPHCVRNQHKAKRQQFLVIGSPERRPNCKPDLLLAGRRGYQVLGANRVAREQLFQGIAAHGFAGGPFGILVRATLPCYCCDSVEHHETAD